MDMPIINSDKIDNGGSIDANCVAWQFIGVALYINLEAGQAGGATWYQARVNGRNRVHFFNLDRSFTMQSCVMH
jgi:hypothetical protein